MSKADSGQITKAEKYRQDNFGCELHKGNGQDLICKNWSDERVADYVKSERQAVVEYDIEAISAKVHEQWMENKRGKGVTTRKLESGEELMVPYSELSEEAKELDRGSVLAVIRAIRSMSKR